jgi:hypothetical protein
MDVSSMQTNDRPAELLGLVGGAGVEARELDIPRGSMAPGVQVYDVIEPAA